MIEPMPYTPLEATMKLMGQIPGSETFDTIVRTGETPQDAAYGITSFAATTFTSELTPGEEIEYLSDWHRVMRDHCSLEYARLRAQNPEATKHEVNEDLSLQILNGIRRGVRWAMADKLRLARKRNIAEQQRALFSRIVEGVFEDGAEQEEHA